MKKIYFALLASACWLGIGIPQAVANEADLVTAPVVLHPDQATTPAPAPEPPVPLVLWTVSELAQAAAQRLAAQ